MTLSTHPRLKHMLQISTPAGRRCKKQEKVYPAGDHWTQQYPGDRGRAERPFLAFGAGGERINPYQVVAQPKTKGDLPRGNLKVEDYRFWVGGRMEVSRYAGCRACQRVVFSAGEMKEHSEHLHHTVWLTEVYKLLGQKRLCGVCGKQDTRGGKWGVPLCGPKCIEKWMFELVPSMVMRQGLLEAREKVAGAMEHARKGYERDWK